MRAQGARVDFSPWVEFTLDSKMEQWNGGILEYWKSKADDGLIL
ncbi:hypothetical protein D1AOALGA4SA_13188 [Olavius algarvensis Delta 1 endosymbiont]|nr:hypothetical protein D1AOALGA4SA_13188 [Olavius algarvensis Delta 1 endosymbiont]